MSPYWRRKIGKTADLHSLDIKVVQKNPGNFVNFSTLLLNPFSCLLQPNEVRRGGRGRQSLLLSSHHHPQRHQQHQHQYLRRRLSSKTGWSRIVIRENQSQQGREKKNKKENEDGDDANENENENEDEDVEILLSRVYLLAAVS